MAAQNLTPEQLHALAVVGREATKFRKQLKPGTYHQDFTVRIHGDLAVAADALGSTSTKPGLQQLVEALISRLPKSRRAEIVDELIAAGQKSLGPANEATKELADRLISGLTAKISGMKTGSVTGEFEIFIEE